MMAGNGGIAMRVRTILHGTMVVLSAGILAAAGAADGGGDGEAAGCAGRRAWLAAGAWKHIESLPFAERAAGTIPTALLAERDALPRVPLCGHDGHYALRFTGDAVEVVCAAHGSSTAPRPPRGADPLAPFLCGCAAAQRTIEIALGLFAIERGVDGESAPAFRALVDGPWLSAEPRCPAGGTYSIVNERGALHPDCSLHGPLVTWSPLPHAVIAPASTAPVRLIDTEEGRASICAGNRRAIVDAIDRAAAAQPLTGESGFRVDLLVEAGFLRAPLACPEAGPYAIRNEGREIRVECPRHGRDFMAY